LIGESQYLSAGWIIVSGAGPRRQSLPGTGRGDRAKRGGRGPSMAKRGEYRFQYPLQILVDLIVPEAEDAKPIAAKCTVSGRVAHRAFVKSVRRPVHLDREVVLEADEIDDVGPVRTLAAEVIPERSPFSQVNPQFHFLWRHRLSQASRAFVGHDDLPQRTPPTALRAVPPPRSGEGLALAPILSAQGRLVETGSC
jgi:hypothetical protein